MAEMMTHLLRKKWLNGWYLFSLIGLPISIAVIMETQSVDLSTGDGLSHMIGYAVRFAVPIIFVVAATSALQLLFPNSVTRWLMRNRKYVGLTFAVAMFWQAVFILFVSTAYRDYYLTNIYLFRDELEGSIGYILLGGMVVTSFYQARKKLSGAQWDLIQKSGLYVLWAYAFSVYWWNLTYPDPQLYYFIFYGMGLVSMLLRIAGWSKKQSMNQRRNITKPTHNSVNTLLGQLIILLGIIASLTPMLWGEHVTTWMTSAAWSSNLVLWLPFWPFEPFLPLLAVLVGARLQRP